VKNEILKDHPNGHIYVMKRKMTALHNKMDEIRKADESEEVK
jgi:hypothetical protein